jgi:tRNA (guanine37-N1)-methyltransferase
MLALKVPEKEAEKAKRELLRRGLLKRGRRVRREAGFVLFPLEGNPAGLAERYELLEADFEGTERRGFRDLLREFLSDDERRLAPTSFEIVGDLAVLEIPEELEERRREIGACLLQAHRHLRAVFRKKGKVKGEARLRELELLAGGGRSETLHREHGCTYRLDLRKVYFSPRLGTERQRILEKVGEGEVVVDLFAGVGPFSIPLAKHRRATVYAVEKSPDAYDFLKENIALNRVEGRVIPLLGDCREVALRGVADRVLMNLPKRAVEFFPLALDVLKEGGGVIHLYTLLEGEDLPFRVPEALAVSAAGRGRSLELLEARYVRSYAPYRYHIALDLRVTSATSPGRRSGPGRGSRSSPRRSVDRSRCGGSR